MKGILFLILCTPSVFSQQNISLTGKITDASNNHEPVEAASIELLRRKDSAYVAGAISDRDGVFVLPNLSAGRYILKATFIGYLPVTRRVRLDGSKSAVDLGRIGITASDIFLAETVVEGKKPEVTVKDDTVEYDAASYKTPENAVVEDLLKKLPGVEVDKDGKITVNGKEVKKFKVDGKDFFSDDPQVTSKNLPADIVDKLQVIDEKSDMARITGFDDGEEMTVINLTIREGMKKGTMGNALLGLGADIGDSDDRRYQGAVFLNSMQNETRYTLILGRNNNNNMGAADLGANRFGGMRMRRGGGGGIATSNMLMMNMNREFSSSLSLNGDIRLMGSDRLSASTSESVTNRNGNARQKDYTDLENNYVSTNLAANFTVEWKPDTANTLTFRPQFGYNSSNSSERGTSGRYNLMDDDSLGSAVFNSQSAAVSKGYGYDLSATLDYAHRFGKAGRVFSLNMQGGYNTSASLEYSTTLYDNPTALYRDLHRQDENSDRAVNYRIAVSYVEPLWKNTFLQASYRFTHNDTRGVNSTFDIHEDAVASRVDSLSRSTVRSAVTQRIGLSLKFVRPKYNYTIGFNVDPSRSENKTYQPGKWQTLDDLPYVEGAHLTNVMGDSLFSSIPQRVVNFSPAINFNYNFSRRSSLRINYDGETGQPTAKQLRAYTDMSNPANWEKGNPRLKPGYENSLRIRFQKYVPETQLMYNTDFSGGFSINDISATTLWQGDTIRITTYDNINGNWNINLRGMFNIPLKNKKFSVGNFTRFQLTNQNSYITDEAGINSVTNTMKTCNISDRGSINYRSDLFDAGLDMSIGYTHIASSIRKTDNKETLNLGVGANTAWYLPGNITIDSDVSYTRRSGSFAEYNIPETIWNASVTKQLFNKRYGAGSLKLQIYDILRNRSNITASATTNGYSISTANVIPSYFIGSFIYKFSVFPKSSTATESDIRNDRRPDGFRPGQGMGRPPF